jgi:ribosome-associated protein
MKKKSLNTLVEETLDDTKAQDLVTLDVRHLTPLSDYFVICTASSNRHAQSIAQHLIENAKHHHYAVLGLEGEKNGEWILVDLGDVIIHVMQQSARNFYQLEKLWTTTIAAAA